MDPLHAARRCRPLELIEMHAAAAVGDRRATEAGDVSYFAYGSNLHPERRRSRADIAYREATPARLEGWRLVFNLPGLQIIEPAMASVEPARGEEVHGLLLRLSKDDFERLATSEGAGRFYDSVACDVRTYDGGIARAVLFCAKPDQVSRREIVPSLRYMELIRQGARLSGLDAAYCDRLDRLPADPIGGIRKLAGELLVETVSYSGRVGLSHVAGAYLGWLQRLEQRRSTPGGRALVGALVAPCAALGAFIRLGREMSKQIGHLGQATRHPRQGGERP